MPIPVSDTGAGMDPATLARAAEPSIASGVYVRLSRPRMPDDRFTHLKPRAQRDRRGRETIAGNGRKLSRSMFFVRTARRQLRRLSRMADRTPWVTPPLGTRRFPRAH